MENFNKNIIWSILSQFSNYGLSLIFTIFLARVILPYEYGIIDQAQTITAFFIIFADGGIVWSIVREKFIKNEEVINLFWLNTLVGLVLFLACYLSAPFIASFYNQPEVEQVLKWLGLIFVLTGLSTPFQMWLKRTMEFKKLTLIQFTTTLLGGIISLYFAYNGYGYWSLVILALSKAGFLFVFLLIFSKMPIGIYKFNLKIKHMINFGLGLVGFGIVNYFARNLDNVLIGKYLGAEQLAFYAKAYFLMFLPSMLITGALTGLMVSVLSKVQDDNEKFQEVYSKVLRMIFVITFPVTGYFLFFPEDPIYLFYGSNWEGSVILLQFLGIATITQPLYNTMGWTYTAMGKSKKMFNWGIISSIFLSLSFVIGSYWGAVGIAISYSLTMGIVLFVWGLFNAHKIANIHLIESFKPLLPILILGIFSLIIIKTVSTFLIFDNQYFNILLKSILFLITYIALLFAYYRKNLISLIKIKEL